jgi:hypothetical protein
MKTKMEELKARRAERATREQIEDGIIAMLPDDLPKAPTISNVHAEAHCLEPCAWLGFSGPSYDPDNKWNPVAVLESLERAGWKQMPASLCQWDDYRRSPEFGLCEAIPDKKPGGFSGRAYELKDVSPIAPLWIKPEQYCQPEATVFMQAPDGRAFHVYIGLGSRHNIGLTAKRLEFRGGWHYARGSAGLRFPKEWHGLEHCTISEHTRAWVDTDQGISGVIYFAPHGEQSAWPLTASAFLASLIGNK